MITIDNIKALVNNEGLTLKHSKAITHKTGWQVATEGKECKTANEAMDAINAYNGDCGVWFSDGIYFIDKSKRVSTKKEALEIGRKYNQISILNWRTMDLVYC